MAVSSFAGRSVVVMGLGRFGGGISAARWLVGQGAKVTVTDLAPAEKLADSLAQLEGLPIRYRLGGHDLADLTTCELLVVSPAVPKDRSPFLQAARERRIPITSEMNLFVERCPARRVVGITGSAGKSTTTAMLGAILQTAAQAGAGPRCWVGGNIGRSLLEELPNIASDDVVVLELSSFQLEDLGGLRWSPPYAVVTNISPNHLDRHGTMEAYRSAKLNIVRYQGDDGLVFIHDRDEELADQVTAAGAGGRLHRYAFAPLFKGVLQVPGRHNEDNAAAAIAVARALGTDDASMIDALRSFRGLPHRLEFVGQVDGVRYFNDSKSTTPGSAILAAEAFAEPVVMLIGGRDKGMPFDALADHLAGRSRGVVCYGEMAETLYQELARAVGRRVREEGLSSDDRGGQVQLRRADTLGEAVEAARALAQPGDVVVLSPACTSYDQFINYEQRGDTFRERVGTLAS